MVDLTSLDSTYDAEKYGKLINPPPAPRAVTSLDALDRELRSHIDVEFFYSPPTSGPASIPQPAPREVQDTTSEGLLNRDWVFRKPRLADDLPRRKWHPQITTLTVESHWEMRLLD